MTFTFSEHVVLLTGFLDRHEGIAARLEDRLLNVQGKGNSQTRERAHLQRILEECFFDEAGPDVPSRLRGQLAAMHRADGFVAFREASFDVLDPVNLIVRAYDHWERHRWPGRSGRLSLARNLYAAFILRQLEHLSLRIWTGAVQDETDRLQAIQRLLDRLNETVQASVRVRNARWLIQTAQGPLTRDLEPYFRVAGLVAESFPGHDGVEIHKAGALLAGGHLRSQLKYRSAETGRAIEHPDVVAVTRNSNSMDAALLVCDLVPLLNAYEAAGQTDARIDLAGAIFHGVSADPELFLTRLDLLMPCTMIEALFIERHPEPGPEQPGTSTRYTGRGEAHLQLLQQYGELIRRLAPALLEDALRFAPAEGSYSPFGLSYGFCADLLSMMALGPLVSQPPSCLSLEDVFDTRARIERSPMSVGAAALPTPQGQQPIEYSHAWADRMFARTMDALRARAHQAGPNVSGVATSRLYVAPEAVASAAMPEGFLPRGIVPAQEHLVMSDLGRALASGATAFPKSQIASDRREGRFLASAECGGTWFGVSKTVLTECIAQGKDALITGVPSPLIDVLPLTCGEIVCQLPASSS